MDTRKIGQQAEELACVYLQKRGCKVLARNYRCALGEIDLIMQDKDDIVFVEVRKRSSLYYASPAESVTPSKQHKLIKTAMHYLQKQRWFDKVPCRFDIIGIFNDQVEWIKDAFPAENF